MSQSRMGSFIEACTHTAVGFVFSILLSLIVYPLFGHAFTLMENVGITTIFTLASIIRGYFVRRWFNARIHAFATKLSQ